MEDGEEEEEAEEDRPDSADSGAEKTEKTVAKLKNQFNFSERGSQTPNDSPMVGRSRMSSVFHKSWNIWHITISVQMGVEFILSDVLNKESFSFACRK